LAIDANFRLKCCDISTEEKDLGLATGLSFFREVKKYMAHLDKNWDYKQLVRMDSSSCLGTRLTYFLLQCSSCVAHNTVDKPDHDSLWTASSGIGTIDCP
jgi:hypothetical protein